jgi:hypothetical protein
MTGADWGILIPAVAGCLAGLGAWLRAEAAHKRIAVVERRMDNRRPPRTGSMP